jgi:hypothetical protein
MLDNVGRDCLVIAFQNLGRHAFLPPRYRATATMTVKSAVTLTLADEMMIQFSTIHICVCLTKSTPKLDTQPPKDHSKSTPGSSDRGDIAIDGKYRGGMPNKRTGRIISGQRDLLPNPVLRSWPFVRLRLMVKGTPKPSSLHIFTAQLLRVLLRSRRVRVRVGYEYLYGRESAKLKLRGTKVIGCVALWPTDWLRPSAYRAAHTYPLNTGCGTPHVRSMFRVSRASRSVFTLPTSPVDLSTCYYYLTVPQCSSNVHQITSERVID